jgi:hypothetical protein
VSDDDPFEELDEAVGDRDGEPLEPDGTDETDPVRKVENVDTAADREPSDDGPAVKGDGPETGPAVKGDGPETGPAVKGDGPETGPTGEWDGPQLGPAGEASRPREGDPFESIGDAFTETEVEGVDPDEVWQRLSSAESAGSVTREAGRTYAEVSKHSYCEQCEYFSEPPDVECSAEGTEIVEFLDMEQVRVVDCPVVAERTDLDGE